MEISFDDTEVAFAYKSGKELKKARFLFSSMGIGWLVQIGTRFTPWALKLRLPIRGLIKNTIFSQFVGGESLDDTKAVASILGKYNVKVILDYGVEGKQGEENFDHARDEFLKVIQYAAREPNIPFMSIKLTGFARFGLLEKIHAIMDNFSAIRGDDPEGKLSEAEFQEWSSVKRRLNDICDCARSCKVGVLIDAEESWIQNPVDALCMQVMKKYNTETVLVYNTIQLYRHDRLQFLKESLKEAKDKGFILGAKLVRGAYMEKERKRAITQNYPSPIQPDKQSTDNDYNSAVEFCISNLSRIYLIVASHNELSNLFATQLLIKNNYPLSNPHVHFSQLYGMSDNITFNLAKAGCSVSKYLPFGPLGDVIPYLMRRAQENSSVSGQTGRELSLIKKELRRRGERS